MTNVEQLTPELIDKMEQHIVDCIRTSRQEPVDRQAVNLAIAGLCKEISADPPPLIFCSSPFESIAVQTITWLMSAKNGEAVEAGLRKDLNPDLKDDPQFRMWCRVWSKIEEHLDVVKEMIRTAKSDPTVDEEAPTNNQLVGTDLSSAFSYHYEKLRTMLDEAVSKLPIQIRLKLRDAFIEDLRNRQPLLIRAVFGQRTNLLVTNPSEEFMNQLSEGTRAEIEKAATSCINLDTGRVRLGTDNRPHIEQVFASFLSVDLVMRLPDWFPMYSFMVRYLDLNIEQSTKDSFNQYFEMKQNAINVQCFTRLGIICEYPVEIHFDERRLLHRADGPAVVFTDGLEVYVFNGVVVRKEIIENPETLTVEKIDAERNVEVRRVMLRQLGLKKYFEDSGAVPIDSDEFGILYKREQRDDEPIVVLRVKDPTPDETGVPKEYFLRVPPHMTTAKAAVAWTFNLRPQEYEPTLQA